MLQIAKYKGFCVLLVMAMVTIFVGCKKNLVEEPGDATVSFVVDWSAIKPGAPVPADAMIYLYPKSGGAPIASRSNAVTKAEFKVKAGSYRIVMYNEGLEKIRFANSQSYESFVGYLEPVPVASGVGVKGGENLIVPESDYLHLLISAPSREVEILANVNQNLILTPHTATNTLRMSAEIRSPKDFTVVRARLSGIATRIELFAAKVLGEGISSVDVPMSFTPKSSKKMAVGQAEIIGIDPVHSAGSNMLELILTPAQGGVADVVLKQDLTEKLSVYENMNIVVEILVKPDPDDPDDPDKLTMEIEIKPWVIDPPLDFDVVPTE